LQLDPIPLRARQAELRGVFHRLARRGHRDLKFPEPSEADLTEWLCTFGGDPAKDETTADLVAFSAAVMRKLGELFRGRWQLTHKDAIDQIREVYLQPLSDGELDNLLRVCVAETLELGLPDVLLTNGRAALRHCNTALGIVFRTEVGTVQTYVRYRLAHAALGGLLLSASYKPVDQKQQILEMSVAAPLFGYSVASKLYTNAERKAEASEILSALIASSDALLLFENMVVFGGLFTAFTRAGLSVSKAVIAKLAEERNAARLVEMALLSTPVQNCPVWPVETGPT